MKVCSPKFSSSCFFHCLYLEKFVLCRNAWIYVCCMSLYFALGILSLPFLSFVLVELFLSNVLVRLYEGILSSFVGDVYVLRTLPLPSLQCVHMCACVRLLHSVVNNSCGFHPQWKVVALIFSAARLPRLLEEICWQLRQVCQLSLRCPFFRTQTPTCLQSWLHFRTPGWAPKKGPCPSFQDSVLIGEEFGAQNMGSRFGTQFWGPNLGPPSHAFLVAAARDGLAIVQILTRCQEQAAQAVAATSASWINQTDQISSQPCFATLT